MSKWGLELFTSKCDPNLFNCVTLQISYRAEIRRCFPISFCHILGIANTLRDNINTREDHFCSQEHSGPRQLNTTCDNIVWIWRKHNCAGQVAMKVTITEWHAVATWRWDIPEDDVCGICQVHFDATCPTCKFPGDECPMRK